MNIEARKPELIGSRREILRQAAPRIMEKVNHIWGYFNVDYDPNVCLVDSTDEVVFTEGKSPKPHSSKPDPYEVAIERAQKAAKGEKVIGARKIKYNGKVIGAIGVSGMRDWRDELIVSMGFGLFKSPRYGVVPKDWVALTKIGHPRHDEVHQQIMDAIEKAKEEQS